MVAIDLITEHIRMKLQQHDLRRIYPNLEVIPSNFQIRGMHTIIRDRQTSTADYVFYSDRLLRLVVEASLGHLPFRWGGWIIGWMDGFEGVSRLCMARGAGRCQMII